MKFDFALLYVPHVKVEELKWLRTLVNYYKQVGTLESALN
jgi:hypothetical protein